MSKCLIFSDAHVHQHKNSSDRLQDCLNALEWVLRTAKERGIKNILFLGDLFHERQKIDVLTYQRVFQVFERFCVPTPPFNVYLLLGNHDLWHLAKWDVSSVFPLRTIPGVQVIDRPCTIPVDGFDVSFLPYTHDPIADLAKIRNDSGHKVLCGHVAIDGAVWNVMHGTHAEVSIEHDGDMIKVDTDVFAGWDQVFLGHYHAEQKLSPSVEYVGSPLQLSFGEAFQHKHILVYDLKTHEKEYIRNTFSPQHFIIPEKDVPKYRIGGNFIRIMVEDIAGSDVVDLRAKVAKQQPGSLEIKPVEKKVEAEREMVEDAKSILSDQGGMLEKYVEVEEKRGGLGGLDKNILLSIGRNICGNKEKFENISGKMVA